MWELTSGIPPFNNRVHDIQLSLSICKGKRPEIIENTPRCYVNLMKKCWDEDSLKRPSSKEVLNIIKKWIFFPIKMKIEDINDELKYNIMEFIMNSILLSLESSHRDESNDINYIKIESPVVLKNRDFNDYVIKDYYSRLLDENTSKKLVNEILESENLQANIKVNEILVSKDLNDYIIKDLKSLDIKTDEN
ncbi:unnamed protein product [Rhizophagus irregularis]|nr:unnamed protein product [Rhizophagus irregularis]